MSFEDLGFLCALHKFKCITGCKSIENIADLGENINFELEGNLIGVCAFNWELQLKLERYTVKGRNYFLI